MELAAENNKRDVTIQPCYTTRPTLFLKSRGRADEVGGRKKRPEIADVGLLHTICFVLCLCVILILTLASDPGTVSRDCREKGTLLTMTVLQRDVCL